MPRKSRNVSNCVQSSRKRDDEDGTSQVSVTSHSSASSQATLDVDQADQVSIQEPLPSRPTRAAKVKCLQQLPKIIDKISDDLSRHDEQYVCEIKSKSSDDSKQHKKKLKLKPKMKVDESVEDYEQRLEKRRQYELKRRTKESVEKRKEYLERQRLYAINRRANETVEEREARLERERQLRLIHKAAESADKLEQRRKKDRQYRLQCRANETTEQRKQRLERIKQYRLKRKASESAKQWAKSLENIKEKKQRYSKSSEQNDNCLKKLLRAGPKYIKSEISKKGDEITEDIKHTLVEKIKTEPSSEEYNQCYDSTVQNIDTKSNVNYNDNNEFASIGSITNINIKTEDTVLVDNTIEVTVLKQEIDEPEDEQQIIFNEENSSTVDDTKIEGIIANKVANSIQTSLTETVGAGFTQSFLISHSSDSSQESLNNSNKMSILSSLLSQPARSPQVPNLQQLLKTASKDKPCSVNPGQNTEINLDQIIERMNASKRKINETIEEHELRLAKQRQYELNRKANESVEQKKQRLEKRRVYLSKAIANESVEQRERRLERQRKYALRRKIDENSEQRQRRLARQRKYDIKRKANETAEEHEKFLERHRKLESKLRASKSAEQREQYRLRRRENRLKRIANETAEQREQRLEKRRQYLSQKRAKENSKQDRTTKDTKRSAKNIKTKGSIKKSNQFWDTTTSESGEIPKFNVHGDGKIHESDLVDNIGSNNNITEGVILLDEVEEVVSEEFNTKSRGMQKELVDSNKPADNPMVQNDNSNKTYNVIRGMTVEVEIKSESEDS